MYFQTLVQCSESEFRRSNTSNETFIPTFWWVQADITADSTRIVCREWCCDSRHIGSNSVPRARQEKVS